ncbi:MAG: PAS domain S-box protein [Bdellovibrionia bacterium]
MDIPPVENHATIETMIRAVVEGASEGVLAVDATGTIHWANPMAEQQFAYSSGELTGRPLLSLIPESFHEKHAALIAKYFRTPIPRPMGRGLELSARRKDGSLFPVEISLGHALVRDTYLAVAFVTDITQRKALQNERDRLVEVSSDLMCSVSLDGAFKQVNPAFTQQLGWSRQELLSHHFEDFLHPDDVEKSRTAFNRLLAGEDLVHFETRHICKDRSIRFLEWNVPPQNGSVIYAVGRDITERKRADESRVFLASIVQSSEDGIVGTDLGGKILSWNRAAERLFGYTEEEAVGRLVDTLLPPERKGDYLSSIARFMQHERIERFEAKRARKDGMLLDISVILSPIKDADETLVGVSAIYRDISERKKWEADLLWAKEAAEAASQIKSEFLANMSHEIRTPMNGIIGMTDVLLDTETTDEQRGYLNIVKTSAESLLAIVNEILDISKIEARKVSLNPKHFELRNCVGAVLTEMAGQARQKDIALKYVIQPQVPEIVLGDETRLRQVLINLIGNAIKFTAVGEVELRVESEPQNFDFLRFSVRDTGSGVAPDKLEKIFEAFTQADSSITRKFGGTGLGLTIAAKLVELMDGRIWVESDGKTGSTFYFTVRLEPHPTVLPEEQPSGVERRRDTRIATLDPVQVNILRPFSPILLEGQLLNISEHGLKIQTVQFLDLNALVQVTFGARTIVAEVRYCLPAGRSEFLSGLEIIPE